MLRALRGEIVGDAGSVLRTAPSRPEQVQELQSQRGETEAAMTQLRAENAVRADRAVGTAAEGCSCGDASNYDFRSSKFVTVPWRAGGS